MPNLTEEQKGVVREIIKHLPNQQIQTLGGYAGTGKTTVIRVLAEALPEFAICAYTGKAANVLRKKGMTMASTIHSLIYKPLTLPDGRTEWLLMDPWDASWKGFLVDEASMVSQDIYNDLLSFGMPIIFVGDHGQLEPVGSDINVMKNPMYRLETVHRNAGEIAHFAEHLRKGNHARTFEGGDKVHVIGTRQVRDDLLTDVDQVICAFNRFRVEKNAYIRKLLGHTGLIQEGERVMCLRNNKRMGLFNGMQGRVLQVKPGKPPTFDFESDGNTFYDIPYDVNQFGKERPDFDFRGDSPNPFDYAYCITAHKSQGDEMDRVLVFEQECDKWDHKRWTYTSASRAKQWLCWATQRSRRVRVPDYLE